ncbi:hypothetical protein D3C71_1596140 [compost metagenome]
MVNQLVVKISTAAKIFLFKFSGEDFCPVFVCTKVIRSSLHIIFPEVTGIIKGCGPGLSLFGRDNDHSGISTGPVDRGSGAIF